MESEPDRVDIEISNATLTEAVLHCRLLRRAGSSVVEPVSIDGASSSCQGPRNPDDAVVLVQDVDLGCDLRSTTEIA